MILMFIASLACMVAAVLVCVRAESSIVKAYEKVLSHAHEHAADQVALIAALGTAMETAAKAIMAPIPDLPLIEPIDASPARVMRGGVAPIVETDHDADATDWTLPDWTRPRTESAGLDSNDPSPMGIPGLRPAHWANGDGDA